MSKLQLVPKHLYSGVNNPANQKAIVNYLFHPQQYAQACATMDPPTQRNMRVAILNGTIDACRKLEYHVYEQEQDEQDLPKYTTIKLDANQLRASSVNTKHYGNNAPFKYNASLPKPFKQTQVKVQRGDCIEAALLLKQLHPQLRIAVLNMASYQKPGGSYIDGSPAQEENLHRRTNLYQCLDDLDNMQPKQSAIKLNYPLQDYSAIYSPDVTVFRGSEAKGYYFSKKPQLLDFISVAAYRNPPTIKTAHGIRIANDMAAKTKEKLRRIFLAAYENQVTALVLSALGCGAYKNPPRHVAELFKEVVQEFNGCFEYVIFAIFEDANSLKNTAEGNVAPFAQVFNTTPEDVVYTE